MAEDMSFSSWARHVSSARNQNSAMGRQMVAATMIMVGLASAAKKPEREISGASMAHANRLPTASHPPDPVAANMNGRFEGFCCRAKMSPPMDGASSLAAMRARGGAAVRRLAARRVASPSLPAFNGGSAAAPVSFTGQASGDAGLVDADGVGARSALGRGGSGMLGEAMDAGAFFVSAGRGPAALASPARGIELKRGSGLPSLGWGGPSAGSTGLGAVLAEGRSPSPGSGGRGPVSRWILPS